MSRRFEKVKKYYGNGNGFWTAEMVRNAVVKDWITAEEADEIIGTEVE